MITANTPSLKASRRPVSDPSKLRGSSAFGNVIRPSLAQAACYGDFTMASATSGLGQRRAGGDDRCVHPDRLRVLDAGAGVEHDHLVVLEIQAPSASCSAAAKQAAPSGQMNAPSGARPGGDCSARSLLVVHGDRACPRSCAPRPGRGSRRAPWAR